MAARRETMREGRRQADPSFPGSSPPASPANRPQPPKSSTNRPHPPKSSTNRPHPPKSAPNRPHPNKSKRKPKPSESPASQPQPPESPASQPQPPESPANQPQPPESPASQPQPPPVLPGQPGQSPIPSRPSPASQPQPPEPPGQPTQPEPLATNLSRPSPRQLGLSCPSPCQPNPSRLTGHQPQPPESPASQPQPPESPASQPQPPESPASQPQPPESPASQPQPPESPASQPQPPESPASQPQPPESPASQPQPPESPASQPQPPESPASQPQPPESPAREVYSLPVVNGKGVLKEPRSPSKKGSGKGLRVTFDLDNIDEYSNTEDDGVIDCWEDISDCEAEISGENYAIKEEDIKCEGKFNDFSNEFLNIETHTDPEDYNSGFIGPLLRPSANINITLENNSPHYGEKSAVLADGSSGLTRSVQSRGYGKGVRDGNISCGNSQPYTGGNGSSIIPFIDGSEEESGEGNADDDYEWETEPSGSSEETVSGNPCEFSGGIIVEEDDWRKLVAEDTTAVEQASVCDDYRDDGDDVITKEDLEAVFLALMEDQEHDILSPIPPGTIMGGDEETQVLLSVTEEDQLPTWTSEYREQSPQVSVGYECRERKSGSETESDGELVPCEDKCVGTADYAIDSDEEPLDLSVREESPSKSESGAVESRDECQGEELSLASDKHQVGVEPEASSLEFPDVKLGDLSPSPEVPEDGKCIGNSESGKEKEKVNGKKAGKKKGKKNKREAKAEAVVKPPHIEERPKLVRGKTWKEKIEKFKAEHGDVVSLSFGNELCESEIVEGTSNLVAESCTEASLLTPARCSTNNTAVMETVCTALSSASGEISDSENLNNLCGELVGPAAALAQVTEVKTCDGVLVRSPTVTSMTTGVAIQVTNASGDEDSDSSLESSMTENDDFYIVKACTVATPSEVLTEYVVDSESSEETNPSLSDSDGKREQPMNLTSDAEQYNKSSTNTQKVTGENKPNLSVSDNRDAIYVDGEHSSCTDSLTERFDYVQSFPSVVGTQKLGYVYSYDDTDSEYESQSGPWICKAKDETSHFVEDTMTEGVSDVVVVNTGEDDMNSPINAGEIIYEGPCLCGPAEATESKDNDRMGIGSKDEQLCIPPLLDDHGEVLSGDDLRMGVETHVGEQHESDKKDSMGSKPEDMSGECEGNSQDIRSRINEIVGPRLQRERERPTGASVREDGTDEGVADDHLGVREDSPLPGSSPASSSGVQGSDEMSLSRSRSRSPPRDDSASPTFNIPDLTYESYQVQELLPEKLQREATESLRALRFESSVESTPEKMSQVDYSFRTFRDMYQINPIYLTDSDEHDDQNESDTVVPGSLSLSYDPERSITVTNDSPAPLESGSSLPLPGTQSARKVPKVTRLLRETQG
ncbi:MAGE-like protein 2-like 2 [Homarus americanus]|uniref:MAGE-like protein 2-like 2 n=1 Tax=Homarus americanus TaxID=6706 RepID=A0A8J5NB36_HOMAM|nr:MAGE-like protein 2-like 2 [Homarus americanus]